MEIIDEIWHIEYKVKKKDENPSIGIIICKTKRRTIVEYALKNTGSPMGVAEYSLSRTLPKSFDGPPEQGDFIGRILAVALNDLCQVFYREGVHYGHGNQS